MRGSQFPDRLVTRLGRSHTWVQSLQQHCSFGPPFSVRALAKSVWVRETYPHQLWPPPGAQTKVWVSPRMRPSLQAVLPFGMVSVLGNSAGAYCARCRASAKPESSQVGRSHTFA
jgi:hypothetical protein